MSLCGLLCVVLCCLLLVVDDSACGCTLQNYTLIIDRKECDQCVLVSTTICSGYCYTQDTNFRGRVGKHYLIQRGCMPASVVYRVARVPGCPSGVNPLISYPEAHRCQCRRCDRRTHHCVRTSRHASNRCRKTRNMGRRNMGRRKAATG